MAFYVQDFCYQQKTGDNIEAMYWSGADTDLQTQMIYKIQQMYNTW